MLGVKGEVDVLKFYDPGCRPGWRLLGMDGSGKVNYLVTEGSGW